MDKPKIETDEEVYEGYFIKRKITHDQTGLTSCVYTVWGLGQFKTITEAREAIYRASRDKLTDRFDRGMVHYENKE